MLPSAEFVPRPNNAPPIAFLLPSVYRARYYKEGDGVAKAPATGTIIETAPPIAVTKGAVSTRTLVGLTALGEPTSYLEIGQQGTFIAALVDQFGLDRFASPCDLELIIRNLDGSDLLVVGTSPFHENPYLTVGNEYDSTSVDFAEGTSTVGQFNVTILDKRLNPLDQRTGIVTKAIADADGLGGLEFELRRWILAEGWATVISGVVYNYRLNSSVVSYTVELRNEIEKANKLRAFTRSTSTVIPRSFAEPWGIAPVGHQIAYATSLFSAKYNVTDHVTDFREKWSLGLNNANSVVPDELVLTEALYNSGELIPLGFTGNSTDFGPPNGVMYEFEWEWPYLASWGKVGVEFEPSHFTAGTQPKKLTAYYNDAYPVPDRLNIWDMEFITPPLVSGFKTSGYAKNGGQKVLAVRGFPNFLYTADSPDAAGIPNNTALWIALRYQEEPSEEYPLWVDMPAKDFVKKVLDGDYGGLEVPMRYDSGVIDTIPGRALMKITEPTTDLRKWLSKNFWAPRGLVPTLNAAGELSPVSSDVPADPQAFPALISPQLQFPSDWEHGVPKVINVIEFTYKRYYHSEDAVPYRVAEIPVTVIYKDRESIKRYGEHPLKFETEVWSEVGYSDTYIGDGLPGDSLSGIENEVGQILARERFVTIRQRYIRGAEIVQALVRRADHPDIAPGAWRRALVDWLPNSLTGLRGSNALAQIISASDHNCMWLAVEMEVLPLAATIAAPDTLTGFDLSFDSGSSWVVQSSLSWVNTDETRSIAVYADGVLVSVMGPGTDGGTVGAVPCGTEKEYQVAYVLDTAFDYAGWTFGDAAPATGERSNVLSVTSACAP